MTRLERKLLLINGVLGASLTLIVLLLDQFGQLQALERWFYDRRALDCQFFAKPPSDRMVFLDIDDNAIDTIDRWPWDRSTMAKIIDEVSIAGPKLIFLDVMYDRPQEPRTTRQLDGSLVTVDHDALLTKSLKSAGNVLMPVSLDFSTGRGEQSMTTKAIYETLLADLELTPVEVAQRVNKTLRSTNNAGQKAFDDSFIIARRRAMFERIEREMTVHPGITAAELRLTLLPKSDRGQIDSPMLRLLLAEYDRVEQLRPLQRFTRERRPGDPPMLSAESEKAPLAPFSEAAGGTGFVDYVADSDGIVRRIPLLAEHRGRVVPQVAFVIACKLLGADPASARVEPGKVIIPCPDGHQVEIPVRTQTQTTTGEKIGPLMTLPFIGGREWETMFDPAHKQQTLHVPMNAVWSVIETQDAIILNNGNADESLVNVTLLIKSEDEARRLAAQRPPPTDADTRSQEIRGMLKMMDEKIAGLKGNLSTEDKEKLDNIKYEQGLMRALLSENQRLSTRLLSQRAELKKQFAGRAVLVGSIATGDAFDFKPTPLHERCPGIVIHGVLANGILTDELWSSAPIWVTRLLTLLMGLATTTFVLRLSTTKAVIATLSLAGGYFLINGIFLFDYLNIIVGVAGPMVAVLSCWVSCQLVEIVIEKLERNRITRRFSTYVDPALVDYVIEHPDESVTEGQEREMTVVFTDLAGFTTISEALKEKVIPLLNEYLGLMSSIIKKHNGLVNKFLGDGIMFFFNAPRANPNHAVDAVETVLEMQHELVGFNEGLRKRGLPAITMRAGITTGSMVVGDAGGKGRSDYTVIGDNVNLAARLESANKATDTKVMMTARTVELLNGQFLVRPTARLQVKGKTEGVDTCELIARTELATEAQRRKAELGKAVFDAFVKSDFAACLRAVETLEAEFGQTKLTRAYYELSEQYLKEPPGEDFDGQIVLHEK